MTLEIVLLADVLAALKMSRRTFERLRRAGMAPVPELLPRLGRRPRFRRADLDAYARGTAGQSRGSFGRTREQRVA